MVCVVIRCCQVSGLLVWILRLVMWLSCLISVVLCFFRCFVLVVVMWVLNVVFCSGFFCEMFRVFVSVLIVWFGGKVGLVVWCFLVSGIRVRRVCMMCFVVVLVLLIMGSMGVMIWSLFGECLVFVVMLCSSCWVVIVLISVGVVISVRLVLVVVSVCDCGDVFVCMIGICFCGGWVMFSGLVIWRCVFLMVVGWSFFGLISMLCLVFVIQVFLFYEFYSCCSVLMNFLVWLQCDLLLVCVFCL